MSGFIPVCDPLLDEMRAEFITGGTGGGVEQYVGGTRIAIAGETISFVNSATIQNVTGNSVTLEPDTAYKITATASAVTLNANVPAAGQWAYEGHAEIFVAGTGYIVTGANVVLANPLEPDAVNNCVLRFHDGTCIIDIEDHVYGYVVTSISGTTQGTLPYGITSATQEYIAFDANTNDSTIDLGGSTASAGKHIVGNGYTSTTLTGAVDCGTSKFTVANLALQDVVVNGGTMTLGDAYIPSGSTVAVSGGGLAIEKVTGAGSESVIDLGGTSIVIANATAIVSGCAVTGGGTSAFKLNSGGNLKAYSATLANTGKYGDVLVNNATGRLNLTNCTLNLVTLFAGGAYLYGQNKVAKRIKAAAPGSGTVTLTSGAILDLTGNTNATPINPGGGVIVEGGCTVINSAGASVSIAGGTYTQINNDGTTE